MPILNEKFNMLRDALRNTNVKLDAAIASAELSAAAFAPTIYDTLAAADTAMLPDGAYYAGYAFAIIKNVRDIGEGAGAGTGALCIWKPAPLNKWRRLDNTDAVI